MREGGRKGGTEGEKVQDLRFIEICQERVCVHTVTIFPVIRKVFHRMKTLEVHQKKREKKTDW